MPEQLPSKEPAKKAEREAVKKLPRARRFGAAAFQGTREESGAGGSEKASAQLPLRGSSIPRSPQRTRSGRR